MLTNLAFLSRELMMMTHHELEEEMEVCERLYGIKTSEIEKKYWSDRLQLLTSDDSWGSYV
jgi:hypothetical protein